MAISKKLTAVKAKTAIRRNAPAKALPTVRAKAIVNATPRSQDAIAILKADHARVNALFAEFESARSVSKKKAIVAEICTELNVHAKVEEEIFYPAVKAALKDKELVPEATVEHAMLKELISQVEGQEPIGEMFDAKISVLSEYVKHHVKEEQEEMFPKAKNSKLDMKDLGVCIAARKEELMPQMAAKAQRPGIVASIKNVIRMAQ